MSHVRSRGRRRRIARGIYRDRHGLAATVKVAGVQRERRFSLRTPIKQIRAWQYDTRNALRSLHSRRVRGRFREHVENFLIGCLGMPSYGEVERNLGLWIDEFGDRQPESITEDEIRLVLERWRAAGYAASTLNHRRGVLIKLWAERFPDLRNHAGNIRRFKEPQPEARGLTWEQVEEILATMPDVGQAIGGRSRGDSSKTKARLRVLAYTGLTHSQLKALRPQDLDLEMEQIRVPARNKGRGVRGQVLPLIPQAVDAFEDFDELDCWGAFSSASLNQSFKRACTKLQLVGVRSYDLRHTFGTEMYRRTGDVKAIQTLMMHASSQTTERYVLSAVDDRVLDAVGKAGSAGRTGWQSRQDGRGKARKWLIRNGAGDGGRTRDLQLGKLTLYH